MKHTIIVFLFLALALTGRTQKIFHIWPGPAPESENWNWQEGQNTSAWGGNDPLAYNIVEPVLTFFTADPAIANGTAVIICPGGSFCYLHTKTEGSDVAKYLNQKGVSAFVLKYRVIHSETDHPVKEKNMRIRDNSNARKLSAAIPWPSADVRYGSVLSTRLRRCRLMRR